MNFTPHHSFSDCQRLERTIEKLRVAGHVSDRINEGYNKYHFSIIHKLQSAKYHIETLDSYLNTNSTRQADPKVIVYRVNFHFDGFLHNLGSALDILAREVLCYYDRIPAGNVYFWTAKNIIQAANPGDQILPLLEDPAWKEEFSNYRNTATHESIIGTTYSVNFTVSGAATTSRLVFPIPDDPRIANSDSKRNSDIVIYCGKTFKRVLSLTNQIYSHINSRASALNSLPI